MIIFHSYQLNFMHFIINKFYILIYLSFTIFFSSEVLQSLELKFFKEYLFLHSTPFQKYYSMDAQISI